MLIEQIKSRTGRVNNVEPTELEHRNLVEIEQDRKMQAQMPNENDDHKTKRQTES